MNKKGQGISMTYIIIAALALIALVVIILFFTGGMTEIFSKITGTVEGSTQGSVLEMNQCKLYCTTGNKAAWDNYKDETKKGVKCNDLLGANYWTDKCKEK